MQVKKNVSLRELRNKRLGVIFPIGENSRNRNFTEKEKVLLRNLNDIVVCDYMTSYQKKFILDCWDKYVGSKHR